MSPSEVRIATLVGRRLRRQRIRLGLSLTSAAEAAGLAVSSLSNIESGKNASLPVVVRLCRALSLRVEEVVDPNQETMGWKGPAMSSVDRQAQELSVQLLTNPKESAVGVVSATLPSGHGCHLEGTPAGVLTIIQKSGCSIIRSQQTEEVLNPGDALTFRRPTAATWLSVGRGHSTALWVGAPGTDLWRIFVADAPQSGEAPGDPKLREC